MPYLAFNLNDGNEFIFDLLEERLSLGRNGRNEIVIDNNQISSFHAEFARQPGGAYLLTDLKSSNGTYVNGRRIESAELKPGDRVRFGQFEARFREMYIPGPGREKRGPAPSAEEKRRDAESTEGPRPRTDYIQLELAPIEPFAPLGARTARTPDVQPIAPTTPPPGSTTTIPKPTPAPLQIVARAPVPAPPAAKPATPSPQSTPQKPLDDPPPHPAQKPVPAQAAATSTPELQAQATALKAEIAGARAHLGKLLDETAAAKLGLEAVRKESQAEKGQAQSLHAVSTQLDMKVSAAQTALHELAARRASEEDRTVLLATIAISRQQEIEETGSQLDGLRQQCAQGEEAVRRLRDQIAREAHRLANSRSGVEATEKRLADLQGSLGEIESALKKSEEAKLAGAALTTKIEERVRELEGKHEVLKRSLHASMDEKTVILFANDLIKRIDLIDILIERVAGPGLNGGMEQQLRTLRASFEDILRTHGIAEFKVAPGTDVDVELRQQIAIIESVPGPARPRVVESYRPGFLLSREGGRGVVLRKVEVKTSSE